MTNMNVRATAGFALALAASLTCAAAAARADGPAGQVEATSLLGRELTRPELPDAVVERHEDALRVLRARLEAHPDAPDTADSRVWIGRHLGYLGRYHEAIETFSEGLDRFGATEPEAAARFLRHRGHRKISIRDLDSAVEDLRTGVDRLAGHPDRVESDGLPNLYNRPTGTLKTNLWYHLGLAHYLRGEFQRAAEAYTACAALADNADMHVAASYWLYLSLRRLGRDEDAARILAAAPLDALLLENDGYQDVLKLFAAGPRAVDQADELLARHRPGTVGAVTLSYGVGAWHLLAGREDEAQALFRRVVDGDGWAGFGFIAAEVELATASSPW